MTIYILNTTILTTAGLTYRSRKIGLVEAKSMIGIDPTADDAAADQAAGLMPVHVTPVGSLPAIVSAVGHQATAEIASTLLGRDVPVSRDAIAMAAGDVAICVKLRTRAPEGSILTRAEVESIGYDLVLLTAEDPARVSQFLRDMEHVAALLCYPDDDGVGEQRPASRRRGNYPEQAHFVVRRPAAYGGTYAEVIQAWGTDAWTVRELDAEEAARNRAGPRAQVAADPTHGTHAAIARGRHARQEAHGREALVLAGDSVDLGPLFCARVLKLREPAPTKSGYDDEMFANTSR